MLTTIDIDIAVELALGISVGPDPDETDYPHAFEFVHDEIDGKRRWDIDHTIVFKYDRGLYGFNYAEPATEYQEGSFEERFEANPVPVFPMYAEDVTTTIYKRL
jgi:hypothetical protein